METIDQATARDIPQLADLLGMLFSQEADFRSDRNKQECGLRRIIAAPDIGIVFAARDGDEIAGMVSLLFTVSTAEGGPACWLEDMVVTPERRGSGLGSRLLRHAIDYACASGYARITLLTDAVNQRAIQFYTRHGFARSQMTALRLHL